MNYNALSHIGFIMDGNRRYAKKSNLELKEGYKAGMLQFYSILQWQVSQCIHTTTFFALSLDNAQKRKKEELIAIKNVITTLLEDPQFEKYCKEHKVEIRIKGRYSKDNQEVNEETVKFDREEIIKKSDMNKRELFDMKDQEEELIRNIQKRVKELNSSFDTPQFVVNIALFYDGQEEIAYATQQIAKEVKKGNINIEDITPQIIKEHIYFNDSNFPQVVVRTGQAPRISGFMLFSSAYSEIFFSQKMWPELTTQDLDEIMNWFNRQSRNFGK